MLMPKRTKYRKTQRGWNLHGKATKGNKVSFGEYGMVSLGSKLITNRQIEAARRTITRALKREGKIWIRIFPDKPYTKKPAETRMGNGKGNVEYYVVPVKPGLVLFEISGVNEKTAQKAFLLARQKFPIPTKMIKRDIL
jgi:large subunit ribosomal protein L16